MRHSNSKRRFGREEGQRKALLNTLAVSLVLHDKIKTTEAKAKELRPFVEKIVTKAIQPTLAKRRGVIAILGDGKATKRLFDTVAPKYKERKGGYLRITKLGKRASDASNMATIEFV